jgi:hypothetical protein
MRQKQKSRQGQNWGRPSSVDRVERGLTRVEHVGVEGQAMPINPHSRVRIGRRIFLVYGSFMGSGSHQIQLVSEKAKITLRL